MSKRDIVPIVLLQSLVYGLEKAFTDTEAAGVRDYGMEVGKDLLDLMKREMGLKIGGNTQRVLEEVSRLLVKELSFAEDIKIELKQELVEIHVKGCVLLEVEKKLMNNAPAPLPPWIVFPLYPAVCPLTNVLLFAAEESANFITQICWPIEVKGVKCRIRFGLLKQFARAP